MDATKQISITIVNKNYPPNPGITGESANELAMRLVARGCKVKVIHTNAVYSGGARVSEIEGERIIIKSVYNGKNKLIRLFASFIESYMLIGKARKESSGLIIVMTDPPFLLFWSALLLKKRKWAYWSMDLYPEAFVAGNLVTTDHFIFKRIKKVIQQNPPNYIIALGKYQLDYLLNDYKISIPHTILPCGISNKSVNQKLQLPFWKKKDGKIYLGYCGNLGEAHSERFLLSVIELLNPQKFVLILSVYGSKAVNVLNAAKNKDGIIIIERVERGQLALIDVHLVTLLPVWNNVCVPSKAVSAVCEEAAILFCGSEENDNWYYLQSAGWFIEESENMKPLLKQWFLEASDDMLMHKKAEAKNISRNLHEIKEKAFIDIEHFAK